MLSKAQTRDHLVKLNIDVQGAPLVDSQYVVKLGNEHVMAINIIMQTKYCYITSYQGGGDSAPAVMISTAENSYPVPKKFKDNHEEHFTIVSFPELKGWRVFAVEHGGYKIRVCLIHESGYQQYDDIRIAAAEHAIKLIK